MYFRKQKICAGDGKSECSGKNLDTTETSVEGIKVFPVLEKHAMHDIRVT